MFELSFFFLTSTNKNYLYCFVIFQHSAMNRSIMKVLIGNFGDGAGTKKAKKVQGTATEVNAEDVIELMSNAKSMIIVPGYGMAVAHAQHAIADLTSKLRARGTNVRFAIHPVAGRLPGMFQQENRDTREMFAIVPYL